MADVLEKAVDWDRLYELFSYHDEQQESLSEVLYKLKVEAYEEAILQEARKLGFDIDRKAVGLDNAQTKAHLRKQARRHAGYIVSTYNKDLSRQLQKMREEVYPIKNRFQLASDIDKWASGRFAKRVETIARTESFTPIMRGVVDFYRQNGIETEYQFTPHESSCDLCKRLAETSPHSIRKVMRVGIPHIGCIHSWAPVVKAQNMPTMELWTGGRYRTREKEAFREQ